MSYRTSPALIGGLYDKDGRLWSTAEREAFKDWLLIPEQFVRDGAIAGPTLYIAAPELATRADVEDVLSEFYGVRLDGVIANYRPAAGHAASNEERFWAYYNTALRNLARERARQLRTRSRFEEPPTEPHVDDAGVAETPIPDPGAKRPDKEAMDAELARLLKECFERVLDEADRELVRRRMDDEPFADIAAALVSSAGALRVRYMRALRRLNKCLRPKLAATTQPRALVQPTNDIDVDVLVFGGGVMGLFLLNDLRRRGYSALLLERERLGGGQTCHSHLYIHDGHVYRELALAMVLKQAHGLWLEWLAAHPSVEHAYVPSIFGFRTKRIAAERLALWDHPALQLPHDEVLLLPDVLAHGEIRAAYTSPEVCLRGPSLVEALSAPVADSVGLTTSAAFRIKPSPQRIDRVEVTLPNGECLGIRCRAVVLAAGAGNQALLDAIQLAGAAHPEASTAQQIRQSYMVAIRGERNRMPQLTGVFHLTRTLFIVARQSVDHTVWLVSDEHGPAVKNGRDPAADGGLDWWLSGVWAALRALAPTVFVQPARSRLEWWAYSAQKAEQRTTAGSRPAGASIAQFGLRNLWVVWPTKLTLAPLASRTIVEALGQFVGVGSRWCGPPAAWTTLRSAPACALERWEEASPDMWNRY